MIHKKHFLEKWINPQTFIRTKTNLRNRIQSTPFRTFIVFAVAIFLKCFLFNLFAFESLIPDSKKIRYIAAFFCGKASISIFIASFIFLFKRYTWTIILSILLDIWCIGNLIYLRCSELLINLDCFKLIDQLNGFESSILSAIDYQIFLFPIITIIYSHLLLKIRRKRSVIAFTLKSRFVFFTALLLLTSCFIAPVSRITKAHEIQHIDKTHNRIITPAKKACLYFMPFCTVYAETHWLPLGLQVFDESSYVQNQNIISYFPAIFIDNFTHDYLDLTDKDINDPDFQHVFNQVDNQGKVSRNLILILVESMESWLITNNDKLSSPLPNITNFIKNNNVLFASKVTSQIKYGTSGDGQMTLNTGLLPISSGVACIAFGSNTFPNLAGFYKHSVLINPCQNNVWNQNEVTRSYGYKQHIRTQAETDSSVIETLIQYVDSASTPFAVQAITIDTHQPFQKGEINHLDLPQKTPKIISNYINAFAHADSILGMFLEKFKEDSVLKNSIIVITGDHTILKNENLTKLRTFAQDAQLDFDGKNYVPLIIYSPDFEKSTFIDEKTYQMDIFPTILPLINQTDYLFKGFGVNLLDSVARQSRYYSEKRAYEISEKIIRSDYLSQLNEDDHD